MLRVRVNEKAGHSGRASVLADNFNLYGLGSPCKVNQNLIN
jgi:hypothetical protein